MVKKSIKISEKVYNELKKYCEETGKKQIAVVNEAILKYIEQDASMQNLLEDINKKIDQILKQLNK